MLALLSIICTAPASAKTTNTTNTKNEIYFKVPVSGEYSWGDYDTVYCHVWQDGGDEFFTWQTSFEKCTRVKGNLWKYDLNLLLNSRGVPGGLKDDCVYAVIFSDNVGDQTYDLYFKTDCIGDTVICGDATKDNPVNPSVKCLVAQWKNNGDKYDSVLYNNESNNSPAVETKAEDDEKSNLSQEMSMTIIIILSVVILLLIVVLVVKHFRDRKTKS